MPSREPVLWDFIPTPKLAPEGSPGLMGYLRARVELPATPPYFGSPVNASLCYNVVDITHDEVVEVTSLRDHAMAMRVRIARYNGHAIQRYEVRQIVVWGPPPSCHVTLVYTDGPYAGAYVKRDGEDSPILFGGRDDALYHAANYVNQNYHTTVAS